MSSTYQLLSLDRLLSENPYPGRGIVIGKTADGARAVTAYFIMGRSENSRNRVFLAEGDDVVIHPFDASKVADPSLIIYSPVRTIRNHLIVTNGDQTDTVYDGLCVGRSFEEALDKRSFEPDAPNFTPRISGLLTFGAGDFTYKMNILKSADAQGSACARYTFSYPALPGVGHFLHTYKTDGNPIPTFRGEPERIAVPDDVNAFAESMWNNLNENNKISLFVRAVDLADGTRKDWLFNKNR